MILRMFLWLIELGTLFMVAGLAFAWLVSGGRSFSAVLRAFASMAIGGAISLAMGLGVGIAAALHGTGDPIGSGLIAAIIALPISLWWLDGKAGGGREPGDAPGAAPRQARRGQADGNVATAWTRAIRLAPLQRQRITSARAACTYVLEWAESHPFDMETVECAVLIRKRLPELVEQTHAYCELAGRTERRTVVEGMVGDLESLGRMAMRRVDRAKAQIGDSLAATRAHIASRTGDEPAF